MESSKRELERIMNLYNSPSSLYVRKAKANKISDLISDKNSMKAIIYQPFYFSRTVFNEEMGVERKK